MSKFQNLISGNDNIKRFISGLLALIMTSLCLFSNFIAADAHEAAVTAVYDSPRIISQPENAVCELGDEFTFYVNAVGTDIKYQWQYSDNSGITWNDSKSKGRTKNTLYLTATAYISKCIYRCCITDAYGNTVITNSVSVVPPSKQLVITQQPQDAECAIGESFTFSLKAEGEGVTYRWQYSDDNGKNWADSRSKGRAKDTLYLTLTDYISKCVYRCCVSDSNGNMVYTDYVSALKLEHKLSAKILSQPVDYEANVGDTAVFSLEAEGSELSYKWQYSVDGGGKWVNNMPSGVLGGNTDTITVPVTSYRKSTCIYRCVITDYSGNQVISNSVRIIDIKNTDSKKGINIFYDNQLIEDISDYDVDFVKDSQYFFDNSKMSADNMTLSCNLDITAGSNDTLLLCFIAYAQEACGKINVKLSGNSSFTGTYAVNTDKTAYYLPVRGISELKTIQLKLTTRPQSVYIGNIILINCKQVEVNKLKTGMFLLDNTNETVYYENSSIAPKTTAMITDGEYLYSIHYGCLTIYRIEQDNSLIEISKLNGLGDTRDMDFCDNGKGLVITSRENGVYFVDISDVKAPKRISHYTAMEMATGLCISGNYAFICSRYYGVEILDISDLSTPRLCSVISDSKEFYDCEIDGDYLYISAWAEKRVEIYNVHDISKPYFVSSALVNGMPGGIDVKDGLLFIATGYNGRDSSSTITSPGYGMGNGMEIYDISNPQKPIWLSTSNIDGRYRNGMYDHWKVRVSGNYAFYSSTYDGIYIYDISNPSAPKRVDHITIRIPNTSSNYHKNTNNNYVFPYDVDSFQQGPVMAFTLTDGCLYLADVYTGVYTYKDSFVKQRDLSFISDLVCSDKTYTPAPVIDGYNSAVYHINQSVFAVSAYNNGELYFAACADGGIAILNSDFSVINTVKTAGSAVDLKVVNDYLFTAESEEGLGIYKITDSNLRELSHLKTDESSFTLTDFEINSDATRIIAQTGWAKFSVINISDVSNPAFITSYKTGTMYNRNLCSGLVAGKYAGVADSSSIHWFDSSGSSMTKINTLTNKFASQPNGVAACGDWALTIYNTGYVYYNPSQVTQNDLNSMQIKNIGGVKVLKGKAVSDGELLAVSFGYGKTVTLVDVSDIDNPILISQFEVDGYPDIASICGDMVIVPLRSGGILVLEKENSVNATAF